MSLRKFKKDTKEYEFYKEMHKNQTYRYVYNKLDDYKEPNKMKMKMSDVLEMMNEFIDPSDPDVNVSNSIHAYQTAERIRSCYPENNEDNIYYWICGLIHDLGKVLFKFGEKSWSIVGDTYVVGCKFPETIVYYDTMKENEDINNEIYNTELGIYDKKCGLDNLKLSYGHDEYLYTVLSCEKNRDKHKFPKKLQKIIRYHSFYPWHTGDSYKIFMTESDKDLLESVRHFNNFDLYSKKDDINITDSTKKFYKELLEKYFPEELWW